MKFKMTCFIDDSNIFPLHILRFGCLDYLINSKYKHFNTPCNIGSTIETEQNNLNCLEPIVKFTIEI